MVKSILAGLLVVAVSGAVYADYTVDFCNPNGGVVTSGTVFGNAADTNYQMMYFGGYNDSGAAHDANTSANGLFLDGTFGGLTAFNYTVLKNLNAMSAQAFAGTTYSTIIQPVGTYVMDTITVGFMGANVGTFGALSQSGTAEGITVNFGNSTWGEQSDITITRRITDWAKQYWNGSAWVADYTAIGTFDGKSIYDISFATDLDLNTTISINVKATQDAQWSAFTSASSLLSDVWVGEGYQFIIGDAWSGEWGTWSQSYVQSVSFAYVPEPATLAMLALGGLMLVRRK